LGGGSGKILRGIGRERGVGADDRKYFLGPQSQVFKVSRRKQKEYEDGRGEKGEYIVGGGSTRGGCSKKMGQPLKGNQSSRGGG